MNGVGAALQRDGLLRLTVRNRILGSLIYWASIP